MNFVRSAILLLLIALAVPLAASAQTPVISSAGSSCDNWDCMWITGSGFLSTSKVWIANPTDWTGQWFYGPALATSPAFDITTDGSAISFQITDATLRASFGNAGLWAIVVNPGDVLSNWSFVQSPPPVISGAGASCADSTCISMTGFFPLNATVDLRPHGQSNILSGSYTGLNVTVNSLALQVTSSARSVWDAGGLDGWAVNPLLVNWTGASIPAVNRAVTGHLDGMTFSGSQYFLQGWACAQHDANSIDVHVYRGGPYGSGGTFAFSATANVSSEPAVAAACGSTGTAYRISIPISSSFLQQYAGQTIWVHGISPFGYDNLLLGGSGLLIFPGGGTNNMKEYIYLGGRLLAVDTTNLP